MDKHDKALKSVSPKMLLLPPDDPLCEGIQFGKVRMQCNTCGFVTMPIRNAPNNICNAQQRAETAHTVCTEIVPANASVGTPSAAETLASGCAPMNIDAPQTTMTQSSRMEKNVTEQHGFTISIEGSSQTPRRGAVDKI